MAVFIITAVFSLLLVAMGVFIYRSKGWWLIAGYNMLSEAERAKYDKKAICRFTGKVVMLVGVLTFPIGIKSIAGWYWIAYIVIVIAIAVFAGIYSNTGGRFKIKSQSAVDKLSQ